MMADVTTRAPWPEVGECYGHRDPTEICSQCDGSHDHHWAVGAATAMGVPARCVVCGARKCDVAECWERRHHRSPHLSIVDGSTRAVGA